MVIPEVGVVVATSDRQRKMLDGSEQVVVKLHFRDVMRHGVMAF